MKSLIINADDIGISDAVNEAVKECYLAGVITGTSIMVCGERFLEACTILKNLSETEVGVHLTLTGRFRPAMPDTSTIRSLVSEEGTFVSGYFEFATRYFSGRIRSKEMYRELKQQILKVKEEGLEVTHLDSHEHIHMFPRVLEITTKLAKEFNVPYIRLPLERAVILEKGFTFKDFIRYTALNTFIRSSRKTFDRIRATCCVNFMGHFHSGRINTDILCFMIKNLPEGVNEIALHPALESEAFLKAYPWYRNAHKEFNTLMDEKWRNLARAEGIAFVTHKQASRKTV